MRSWGPGGPGGSAGYGLLRDGLLWDEDSDDAVTAEHLGRGLIVAGRGRGHCCPDRWGGGSVGADGSVGPGGFIVALFTTGGHCYPFRIPYSFDGKDGPVLPDKCARCSANAW